MQKTKLLFEEQFPVMYRMRFDDTDVRNLITTAEAIQVLDRLELSPDGTGVDLRYFQDFRSKEPVLNTAIHALALELEGLTSISTSGSPLLNIFLGGMSLPCDTKDPFGHRINSNIIRRQNLKRPFGAVFFALEENFYNRVLVTHWRKTGDATLFDEFNQFRLAVFSALSARTRSIISAVTEEFFEKRTPLAFCNDISQWRELKGQFKGPYNSQQTDVVEWIYVLSSEKSGLPLKLAELTAIRNRMQAYNIYGLLFPYLSLPQVTSAIDQGLPVEPILRTVSGLSSHRIASLKRISRARPTLASLAGGPETSIIITTLAASNVSIREWETLFISEKADVILRNLSKEARSFAKFYCDDHLIFPTTLFYRVNRDFNYDVSDSLNDLGKDLLCPLFDSIATSLDKAGTLLLRLTAAQILRPQLGALQNTEVAQELKNFWQTVHAAIVGTKTYNGFQKSLRQLHKFSNSIAAQRRAVLETERVWPELFPAWRSKDGKSEIRFLRSTTELVEEGLRMRHCVGSYDDKCEAGGTHIASISINGTPVATAEISTKLDEIGMRLNLVQFASTANAQPSPAAYRALHEFWKDVKGMKTLANFAEVSDHHNAYHPSAGTGQIHAPRNQAMMTLDKAEKLWPIYRENLLVTHPEAASLKEWMKASGISEATTRLCRVIRRAQAAEPAPLAENTDLLDEEKNYAPTRSL